MADEIRVNKENRPAHEHEVQIEARSDVQGEIPAHPSRGAAAAYEDPEVTRAEIEHTRARMSETIDDIEEALLRKRDQIQSKLDVFGPIRRNPLSSLGVALGAGIVLGFLTGEDDEDEDEGYGIAIDLEHEAEDRRIRERNSTWETRARRLLEIAQEQEDEISALQAELHGRVRDRQERVTRVELEMEDEDEDLMDELEDVYEEAWERPGMLAGLMEEVTDQVSTGIAGFVERTVRDLIRGARPI